MITPNQPLPFFVLSDDTGKPVQPEDMLGSWTVLYFYPKDETPGCTAQACSVRDTMGELSKLGVKVYGISPDSVASHVKFKTNHQLSFPLLADEGHKLTEALGFWQEKMLYGKKYMGVVRSTVIVNPEGLIAAVYPNVKPEGHGEFLQEELQKLLAF